MFRKLFTHSFIYAVLPQLPRIISLALMPIITKYLTTLDYGVYGIITSYLYFITVWKDLGMGVVFVNSFYKNKIRWKLIWRLLFGHLIFWGFVYGFLLIGIIYIAIPVNQIHNLWAIVVLVVGPNLLFDNIVMIGNYYFRFTEKPFVVATASMLSGIISIGVTYYCVVFMRLGYLSWFISSFVSSLILFLIFGYYVFFKLQLFPIMQYRKDFIKRYLKVSLPLIPHNYSTYLLNSSDRVVMNMLNVNVGQIGLYNISYTFANYFEVLGEAVGMAVSPFYSKLNSLKTIKSEKDERLLTYFLMVLFLTSTFLISLWVKEIFHILIKNEQMRSGYDIAIILIMGYCYRPMYWSAGIRLSIYEKTNSLWKLSFIAGLLNVILNLIFVPRFGILAAAVNTLISLFYIGFSGFVLKDYKATRPIKHYPIYWLLLICFFTCIVYLLKDTNILNKSMVSLFVISIILFSLKLSYKKLQQIEI